MAMWLVRAVSVLLLVRLAMSQGSGEEALELQAVQNRYNLYLAEASRLDNHFFCVNRSTDVDADGDVQVSFTEFQQVQGYVWTLFFQFPALAYLDPARKRALLSIVVTTLNSQPPPVTSNPPMTIDDLCIGTFEFYELTTFRESVLFHVYRREGSFMAETIAPEFETNIIAARDDPNNRYVITYPEQPGITALNLSVVLNDDVLLPARTTEDGADPTLLAVYLGSFATNMSLMDLQTNGSINEDLFAENPNPVNYGLEAGDYVFAVLGGILLAAVGGLILLGFCIHPFWLA